MSVEVSDILPDKDVISGDLKEVFSSPYHLSHSTLSFNKAWVVHVDISCDNSKYCAAFSNRQVDVYTPELTTITKLQPHEKTVTKTAFR